MSFLKKMYRTPNASLAGIKYGVPNGTKLRGIVVQRAACLPAKSAEFPIKRHLAQPLRRSNMLNLVPLYGVPRKLPQGDLSWKWSNSDGEWYKGSMDLEAASNVGGFIGAQFALNENPYITTEFSATADRWAVGAGIAWKF